MKKYWGLILIIVLSMAPLFDLLRPGLPITHDGQDHVARIANFYQSLSEGNIVPRWAANLNWGYGHPILMFLYPLPSYIASLFHFLGFSFVDSVKIVFALAYIASGVAMYLWVRNFLGEHAGVAAGILYLFAPYRFVDLYVRGAIGEHVAFIFPPLILYFLLKLSKTKSAWCLFGGSFSLAALLLSHNAVSIMFLPFIIFYGIYLVSIQKQKKELIYQYTSTLVLGFGLASFFLIPAYFEGKYTLRDIVTNNREYGQSFVAPLSFLYGEWSHGGTLYLSKQIGIIQIALIILSFALILKKRKQLKNNLSLYLFVFIYLLSALFLVTKWSDFLWSNLKTLQKFQFPWRFLSVVVFSTSVLGSFVLLLKNKKMQYTLLVTIVVSVFFANFTYWHAKGYLNEPQSFYTGVYDSTTDTGESSPIWSVRFMEKRAKDTIEVIDGTAKIQKGTRSSTHHEYRINVLTDQARIRENTLYFPGWNVFVDGKPTRIEFQDPKNRGLMTFYVPTGSHEVKVEFGETKLRLLANSLSVVTLFFFVLMTFIMLARNIPLIGR